MGAVRSKKGSASDMARRVPSTPVADATGRLGAAAAGGGGWRWTCNWVKRRGRMILFSRQENKNERTMSNPKRYSYYVIPQVPQTDVNALNLNDLLQLQPLALGTLSTPVSQANTAIALGRYAGSGDQGEYAVAIGESAARTAQRNGAVAIGRAAGQYDQNAYAVAVGAFAGQTGQHANSIILNASGAARTSPGAGSFTVDPIRLTGVHTSSLPQLQYDTITKEVVAAPQAWSSTFAYTPSNRTWTAPGSATSWPLEPGVWEITCAGPVSAGSGALRSVHLVAHSRGTGSDNNYVTSTALFNVNNSVTALTLSNTSLAITFASDAPAQTVNIRVRVLSPAV